MFDLVVAGSLLVKVIVDNLKFLWKDGEKLSKTRVAALVLSVGIFTLFGLDFLTPMGFDIPYFDGVGELIVKSFLSGIVAAGGAGVFADLVSAVERFNLK